MLVTDNNGKANPARVDIAINGVITTAATVGPTDQVPQSDFSK